MLDILFTIVIVLLFILCFVLHRRLRKLGRQVAMIVDHLDYLLEKEKMSADADGADDRCK